METIREETQIIVFHTLNLLVDMQKRHPETINRDFFINVLSSAVENERYIQHLESRLHASNQRIDDLNGLIDRKGYQPDPLVTNKFVTYKQAMDGMERIYEAIDIHGDSEESHKLSFTGALRQGLDLGLMIDRAVAGINHYKKVMGNCESSGTENEDDKVRFSREGLLWSFLEKECNMRMARHQALYFCHSVLEILKDKYPSTFRQTTIEVANKLGLSISFDTIVEDDSPVDYKFEATEWRKKAERSDEFIRELKGIIIEKEEALKKAEDHITQVHGMISDREKRIIRLEEQRKEKNHLLEDGLTSYQANKAIAIKLYKALNPGQVSDFSEAFASGRILLGDIVNKAVAVIERSYQESDAILQSKEHFAKEDQVQNHWLMKEVDKLSSDKPIPTAEEFRKETERVLGEFQ